MTGTDPQNSALDQSNYGRRNSGDRAAFKQGPRPNGFLEQVPPNL